MGDSKTENFLILTNPLTWVLTIIILGWLLLEEVFDWLGIMDWYFTLFKYNSLPLQSKEHLVKALKQDHRWKFFLKRWAINYYIKKVENEQETSNKVPTTLEGGL